MKQVNTKRVIALILYISILFTFFSQLVTFTTSAQNHDGVHVVKLSNGTWSHSIDTDQASQLSNGKIIFTLPGTYNFDDSTYEGIAEQIANELSGYSLTITSYHNNSAGRGGDFDITVNGAANYELVGVIGNNNTIYWGIRFMLKIDDTIQYNGSNVKDNNIYVQIVSTVEKPYDPNESYEYGNVHGWHLLNIENNQTTDTKYDNNGDAKNPIHLPDMVSKKALESFGNIIKDKYTLYIDYYNNQGAFSAYVIDRIDFLELKGDVATYRIWPKDTFNWQWGNLVEFYVTVDLLKDATRLVLRGKDAEDAENLDIGVTEEKPEGENKRAFIIWPKEVELDAFDSAAQADFVNMFGASRGVYDRIARSKDGEWSEEYTIERIEYDAELSAAKGPGLRKSWVYEVIFDGDNPVDDDGSPITYYIIVYSAFDETPFIVTDRVTDPENAFVNFFDYWIIDQFYNDYRYFSDAREEELLHKGINNNHLFIFAGGQAFGSQVPGSFIDHYGQWNVWTGNSASGPKYGHVGEEWAPMLSNPFDPDSIDGTYKPHRGIVNRLLGSDGFPMLALGDAAWFTDTDYTGSDNVDGGRNDNRGNRFPVGWASSQYFYNWFSEETLAKYNESLAYLFDPQTPSEGKETFSDVKGLFRMDNQGYYFFDSNDTFAELNVEDGNDKTNKAENRITLYNQTWKLRNASGIPGGQFFPYNNWTNLFELNEDNETVNQINQDPANGDRTALLNQSTTLDPINHYFGMTLEVSFQQPVNGKLNRGASEPLPMTFEFSGDDDVWIFIDDVLVGDLGGIHDAVKITIDFSTGEIHYYALGVDGSGTTETGNEYFQNANHDIITIYDMFKAANMENSISWLDTEDGGKIFANGSIHDLKFFYLERGNDVSNCAIKYNLIPIFADRIRKVDENGNPLGNVVFNIYAAAEGDNYKTGNQWHTIDEFKKIAYTLGDTTIAAGTPIATAVTNASTGYAELIDQLRNPLDLTRADYFIVEEAQGPPGYRLNPDIVVKIDHATDTFTVVNKYDTGSYASFMTEWLQVDKNNVAQEETVPATYATYNPSTGRFTDSNNLVNQNGNNALREGLALVVPVIKQVDANGNFIRWLPMYGSNTKGWFTIADSYQDTNKSTNTAAQFMMDLALAAFLQIADDDVQDWYLNYIEFNGRLEGHMENLPGNATRYVVTSGFDNADLDLVTLFIPAEVLEKLGVSYDSDELPSGELVTDEARYLDLQKNLRSLIGDSLTEETASAYLKTFLSSNGYNSTTNNPFRLLFTDMWQRQYHTVLYLPNEQRELRVRKVDQNGNYIDGAVFAIFETAEAAANFTFNQTYTSTGEVLEALATSNYSGLLSYGATDTVKLDTSDATQQGLLIFQEREPSGYGYGQIDWPDSYGAGPHDDTIYWLRELYCPHGLTLNENLVRIEVGNQAIYANATGYRYNYSTNQAEILPEYDEDDPEKPSRRNDGIKVQAALGKLAQTLVKYAIGNHVDVTLQDITIREQIQNVVGDNNGALVSGSWGDTGDTFNLHYDMNAEQLTGQFGRHSSESDVPVFEAEDGYIRVMPRQHVDLSAYNDADHNTTTKRDILTWTEWSGTGEPTDAMDLDALFGLMNIVVITDELLPASLEISKEVEGIPGDSDTYRFDITLTSPKDEDDNLIRLEDVYHGYIHETGHMIGDRPCAPADHVDDHDDLILIYNGDGTYTGFVVHRGPDEVLNRENAERLVLLDGQTYVIVDLPPETGYEITETIITDGTTTYETRIEVRDEEGRTDNELEGMNVSGDLNPLIWDEDELIGSPESVKVKYINSANKSGLTVEKQVSGTDTNEEFDFNVTFSGVDVQLHKEGYRHTAADINGASINVNVVWDYNEADGTLSGKFKLRHGDKITFSPIEPGVSYTVSEESDSSEWIVTSSGEVGNIAEQTRHEVLFINTPNNSGLVIEKEVVGLDTDEAFDFTVTFVWPDHELPENGYEYSAVDINGETIDGFEIVWELIELQDGTKQLVGSFKLRHGDKVTIAPLSEGIEYEVKEIDADDKWAVTATGETGVISTVMQYVKYTNKFNLHFVDLPGIGGTGVGMPIIMGCLLILLGIVLLLNQNKPVRRRR